MPRNGSGAYSLPSGNPVVTGTVISSTVQNNTMNDIATALTGSLAKDGQTTPTANIPLGGFRITNLGLGTAVTDAARVSQVQNGAFTVLTSVSGTNTIVGTATPAPAAYAAGQIFTFTPAASNTGATTLNVSSLGAKNIYNCGVALIGGEIVSSLPVTVYYDGTQFNLMTGMSFLQTGTGAVDRTAQSKMRDLKARADFNSSANYETAIGSSGTTGYALLGSFRINGKSADDTAWLHVGDVDATSSTDPTVLLNRDMTGAGNAHGFSDSSTFRRDSGTAYNAFDARGSMLGATNIDHLNCFQAQWTLSSSGNCSLHAGYVFAPTMTDGTCTLMVGVDITRPALSGTAAVNTLIGILMGDMNNASVSQYGIKIGDVAGAFTNNYSIYTGTGQVSFGGDLVCRSGVIQSTLADATITVDGLGISSAYFRVLTNNNQRWQVGCDTASENFGFKSGTGAGTEVAFLSKTGAFGIADGIAAPSAVLGYAQIYVDTADGDLKVIFGDGTVKTLATDT